MLFNIRYLIFLLLFFSFSVGFADTPYRILYTNASNCEQIDKLLSDSEIKFINYEKGKPVFKTGETYWIKIEYQNSEKIKDIVLLLNTPISEIECFAFDNDMILRSSQAGIGTDYRNQILRTGDKNKIFLNFQLGKNVIYLKIKNMLLLDYSLDNMQIKPVNEWILNKQKQDLFQGIFFGILIMLILTCLLYKISTIKSINFYYIGYLVSNLVLFFFLNEYTVEFFGLISADFDLCFTVSMHFASLFFIQFARNFFRTKDFNNKFDIIADYYSRISLTIIFSLVLLAYFNYPLYSRIAFAVELSNQLFGLTVVLLSFRKTDLIGKIIILGSVVSTIDILFILFNSAIAELTTADLFIYQLGYIFEIALMFIAIRVRYKQAETEQNLLTVKNAMLENQNLLNEHANLLLRKENEISQLKTQLLETTIQEKNKEIAVNTMQLTQKDLLLNNLHEKIKKIQPENSEINKKEVNEILMNLNNYQKDTFWNEFEIYFEQMHNGFYSKLTEKYPNLTNTEKRLCALLKVGMTSKEIAGMTQKNFKSIEVYRSRLRKKLQIDQKTVLIDFLNSIS